LRSTYIISFIYDILKVMFMKWVISLGGSTFIPEKIDTNFILEFVNLIERRTILGDEFRIVCGGGMICRHYIGAIKGAKSAKEIDGFKIGTLVTRINGFLLMKFFDTNLCYDKVVINYNSWKGTSKKIVIGAGHKLGHSTDFDAFSFALAENVGRIVNVTNIPYVYSNDPKKDPEAIPLKRIFWKDYVNMIDNRFRPGDNFPFDPIASRGCMKNKINVMIVGKDLENLNRLFEGKEYNGTIIE